MATPRKKPEDKLKAGRRTLYREEYCELATNYCLLGATDSELAIYFKVQESTLNLWKAAHPKFMESLSLGRDKADADIAKSLYQRAKGYSHKEDDIRVVAGSIAITPTVKHYPPDTAAASLWLRNRQAKRWRDKVEVEHGGNVGLESAPLGELTDALKGLMKKMQ